MATYKVKEFAEKLGVKPQTVNTWGKRGKLNIINGRISDTDPLNSIFLRDRNEAIDQMESYGEVPDHKTHRVENLKTVEKKEPHGITVDINKAKLRKLEKDIQLAELRNKKIEGQLIPIDIVGCAVGEVIKRYKGLVMQKTDQLVRDICDSNNLGNDKLTKYLSELTDIINESSIQADYESKEAIENSKSDSLSATKI